MNEIPDLILYHICNNHLSENEEKIKFKELFPEYRGK